MVTEQGLQFGHKQSKALLHFELKCEIKKSSLKLYEKLLHVSDDISAGTLVPILRKYKFEIIFKCELNLHLERSSGAVIKKVFHLCKWGMIAKPSFNNRVTCFGMRISSVLD